MSSGPPCKDKTHAHVVTMRYANRSAFNGYHLTPSDYSQVYCPATRMFWRSKGRYVDHLPAMSYFEADLRYGEEANK